MELEEMTVKQLQDKLISLGMPEDDVQAFKTKAPIIASIKTIEAKGVVKTEKADTQVQHVEEIKKVITIEEKVNPTEERRVNKAWRSKAAHMKEVLMAQEKVSILIPMDPNEKAGIVEWRTDKNGEDYQVALGGAVESVTLNGFRYFIPKGRYTPVPRQIAEVISKAQQQTLEAGSKISIDRIDPKTGRPIAESL